MSGRTARECKLAAMSPWQRATLAATLGSQLMVSCGQVIAFLNSRDVDGDGCMDFPEFVMTIAHGGDSAPTENGMQLNRTPSAVKAAFQLGELIRSTLGELRDAWCVAMLMCPCC